MKLRAAPCSQNGPIWARGQCVWRKHVWSYDVFLLLLLARLRWHRLLYFRSHDLTMLSPKATNTSVSLGSKIKRALLFSMAHRTWEKK